MSVSRLPSGRWRSQVYEPATRKNKSVGTFNTKREAVAARAEARKRLSARRSAVTVADFAERWTTDPLFQRPKESTRIHHAERIRGFVDAHGALALTDIDDAIVGAWLAGGTRNGTVPALRAMFNDAASAKAGRLVERNPFAGLGLHRGTGNRHRHPPAEATVWDLVRHARALSGPYFAAWLQVACFTGVRPGELDALRWTAVDLERGRLRVAEQFNAKTRTFTAPKNGQARWAPLTPPAREALLGIPRHGEHCFRPHRGEHFSPSTRAYHWKAIRAAAGYDGTLYLATRHFAGWYMVNVLELPSEDVAIALGHTDGGELVRRLYGHRDTERALDRVADAYARAGNVRPLRAVEESA